MTTLTTLLQPLFLRRYRLVCFGSICWGNTGRVSVGSGLAMMMGMPMFAGGNMMAVMGSFMSHAMYGGLLGFIGGDAE